MENQISGLNKPITATFAKKGIPHHLTGNRWRKLSDCCFTPIIQDGGLKVCSYCNQICK